MRVVIMGCGRVGSSLALTLQQRGHDVAVIDREALAFRRLGPDFDGMTVAGVGFDPDVMREAGIEQAEVFAAVSSGDNSNVIAARVARETFNVPRVAARIYDPKRAEVYQRLGIPTVGTVRWTTDQLMRRLFPEGSATEWVDPSGEIRQAEVHVHTGWVGHRVTDLETAAGCRIAYLTRSGHGLLPNGRTVIQQQDLVHVVMELGDSARVAKVLGAPPAPTGARAV